jgi:hypothetical protein
MLKCAGNDDIITMKADDTGDVVTFMFESPGEPTDHRAAATHILGHAQSRALHPEPIRRRRALGDTVSTVRRRV